MNIDRIEKQVVLRAPLQRVWAAISDSEQFGRWFGARFDGQFVEGQAVTATITPTEIDAEVAKRQEPHAGATSRWQIVAVEPPRRFAYRWTVDPESEDVTTLVEFTLVEVSDGVLLTIVESGFDAIPEARRRSFFEDNSEGWTMQTDLVRRFVEQA